LLWQSLSEVKLLPELCEVNEPKPSVPVKISTCHIDVSVNNISDLLAIIDKYPLQLDTEYNIDLETLHKIKSELTTLDNMIGMDTLKQSIINQLLYFIQNLHVGTNVSDFKHTVIYGPPGTGKTEVARIIGQIYSKIGVLKKNIFKKVTRNDLIAGFLGQTAIKTKQVITDCLGGVLFIDEAYSLASNDQNDSYSKECLDILCEALSEHKDDLMVIIAGYENELNTTFFRANPGLSSRFIWRFSMQPYTIKELIKIFNKMVLDQEWTLDKDFVLTEKWFNDKKDNFSSYGRDIEALITYIKIAHGRRIYGNVNAVKKCINMDDLNTGYKQFAANKQPQDKQEIFGLYV
jgi:SpoVK/Ycf46/Vps4 family AAA+-type ATPase